MLAEQGHTVDVAVDADEAMAKAGAQDFDLVMANDTDEGDVLRLCSHLRSQKETRHGPILLIVDDGSEDRLAKAMELGVNDYLVRPVDRDELIARTRTQVRRKRYEDRLRNNYVNSVNAAVTDSLTGMYNRRYLESHFERVVGRVAGTDKEITLMVLDIDHFKSVNDTHGHDVGDEVLQGVAKRIQSNLRGFDTAVRFGGEEFVVLLPDGDAATGRTAAERLCSFIAATPVPVAGKPEGLPITVSIGVATSTAGVETLDQMVKRADVALYEAKESGRNRVVFAKDGDEAPAEKIQATG
jgi:two-component system cell cycle response regulator